MYDIDNSKDATKVGTGAAVAGTGLLAIRSANQHARKFARGAKSALSEASSEASKASGFGDFKKETKKKISSQSNAILDRAKKNPNYVKAKWKAGRAGVGLRRRILKKGVL